MNIVPNERFLSFQIRKLSHFWVGVVFAYLFTSTIETKAQLVVNEVSQGPSGSQEYVELLVTGTLSCNSMPCVDLRGWYLDDNNGFHASGSGTGIAVGCIRFSQSSQWSCVNIGTIIVVYNDADKNSNLPSDDLYDSNNDCVYIIPVSSSLFERNELYPDMSSSAYPTSGFISGGDWAVIAMANTDDSFQIIDPSNLSSSAFCISWGNNTSNNDIYFGIDASGTVMYMTNSVSDNAYSQSNWTYAVSTDENPGIANNTDNSSWIKSMNNNCQPLVSLSVTATPTNENCSNGDGSAYAVASGGTSPYTYSWSNGKTTASIVNLSAGSYTVTVTDANGCTDKTTITISNISAPSVSISGIDASCGSNNGSASASVSGGTSPYTYSWSNGKTTSSISNLTAGTYTVTVTDANGCTTTDNITIGNSSGPSVTVNGTDASCGQNNGMASITVSGGTSPYTYSWSNGKTTSSISSLSVGTYSVTVTDDNGCSSTASVIIASSSGPTVTVNSTDATCGNNNGSANASVSGGTSPFTYYWSNGKTTSSISNLASGTYTLTVTDDNGCNATANVTINSSAGPTVTVSSVNASCGNSNGTASATVNGGNTPYTYNWSNGKKNATISNLSSGTYTLTVTDANGCTASASITITSTSAPSISTMVTDANCGLSDGSATAVVSGGTSPYSYSWSNGATTTSITNVASGNYSLTVTDINGCTATSSVNINNNGGPVIITSSTDATCGQSNGSASVNVSGGNAPYSYTWSNGSTSSTISNLSAGFYSVAVIDANSCSASESIQINDQGSIYLSFTTTDANCGQANGSASVNTIGGSSPYSYSWSNGALTSSATSLNAGTYMVLVTDANGCFITDSITIMDNGNLSVATTTSDATCGQSNGAAYAIVSGGTSPFIYAWSNGASTSSATGLTSGNYSLTVSDANGCNASASVIINSSGGLITSVTSTNVNCGQSDGTADILVSGGAQPYSYNWSNGSSTSSATGLSAGTYTVSVTDANGCSASDSVLINGVSSLSITTSITDASCGQSNGSISSNINGGTTPYSYNWNNGQTNSAITNLSAGNYSLIVSDVNGCKDSAFVTIVDKGSAILSLAYSDESCGQANGTASVIATGGTSPYSYLWSNGASSSSIIGLAAGTYTITVVDSLGCLSSDSVTITNLGSISLTTNVTNATCLMANGSATVSVSGGVSPYTYLWNDGQTAATAVNLYLGSYTVQVTDALGCISTAAVMISDAGTPVLSLSSTPDSCGNSVGTANAIASGGNGSYTYMWNNNASQSTAMATNLPAGWNFITLTDIGGCQIKDSVWVDSLPSPALNMSYTEENCNLSNATATVVASGGSGIYSYSWSTIPVQNTSMALNLSAGMYSVTVDDGICISTDTVNITSTPVLVNSNFIFDQQETTNDLNTPVYFYNQSTNAQSVFWEFGDGYSSNLFDPYHEFSDTGSYTVMLIAMDENGCADTMYTLIVIDAEFAFYIPNTFSPNGDGKNDSFSGMGIGISEYEMLILDRWGDIIYETNDINKAWKGDVLGSTQVAPIDVYIYKISLKTLLNKVHRYSGHVNLIR